MLDLDVKSRHQFIKFWHNVTCIQGDSASGAKNGADSATPAFATAIWCLACCENLIVAGCGNGSVEVSCRSVSSCVYNLYCTGVDSVLIKFFILKWKSQW